MCDMVGSEGRKKKGTRTLRCAGSGEGRCSKGRGSGRLVCVTWWGVRGGRRRGRGRFAALVVECGEVWGEILGEW